MLALQWGEQTYAWYSREVIGLVIGVGVMLIASIVWENRQKERAVLISRLMQSRSIWANGLFIFFFAGSYFAVLYCLPIYFQSIKNDGPTESGVHNLPLILAVGLASVASGIGIMLTGISAPVLAPSAAVSTIAVGLLYTLDIGTSASKWVGYQFLGGVGWGIAFQIPITIVQGNWSPQDIAPATAIILCTPCYHPLTSTIAHRYCSMQFFKHSGALSLSPQRRQPL